MDFFELTHYFKNERWCRYEKKQKMKKTIVFQNRSKDLYRSNERSRSFLTERTNFPKDFYE